jgi:fatty acid synthase
LVLLFIDYFLTQLNTKNTPLPSGLVGVNAFGFGGANAHAVLRPHTEKRRTTNNLPCRLVHVSGRTKEAVELMLESAVQNKTNEEFLSLLDNIYNKPIDNQIYRGYAVLSDKSHYEVNPSFKKRPVWFVYSGMGSQWPEMAKDLMKIDVFRNTMQKCAAAVKPYGIDLENVVTNGTKETFDNLINTFTAITAVSVCLTDVLTSMKIEPAGFMGHSLGEVSKYIVESMESVLARIPTSRLCLC